jgi:hypothetical protein
LDLISIISGPFTGSKLLLEYGGQQGGFLLAERDGMRCGRNTAGLAAQG